MGGSETNRLVKGALLLTLAGFISKILSAGYRIPLQNLTGDVGFYIYQQVYPILGIATMLALYGFPQAISKIAIDMRGRGRKLSIRSFYIPISLIMFIMNGAIFLFLLLNADNLATWIGDSNLVHTYQFTAIVFLLVPFIGLQRGVFQAELDMKPTALSQVIEQLLRVTIIIVAAVLVAKNVINYYDIGLSAVIASLIGGMAALATLFIIFLFKKPISMEVYPIPWNYYVKTVLILGMVAALNHMVLLVMQFADAFTLVPSLMKYGFLLNEAKEVKGIFDRGQPIIQLGTVLGSSFALALIPSVSKRRLVEDRDAFYFYIRSALKFSFYLAIGATIGIIAIFPEVNLLLYKNDNGTMDLRILMVSILLCSLAVTASSILQGLGFIKRTAGFIIVSLFTKWVLNQLFVPIIGITGAALSTVISLLGLLVMVMMNLKRKLPEWTFFRNINYKAVFQASLMMLAYIYMIKHFIPVHLLQNRLHVLLYVLFMVITGACLFMFLLIRGNALSKREISLLPFSSYILKVYNWRGNNG
ncbi:putative polysaccharide biosynthesis protein [Oceanobacillus senegalensis]|uniref:putative polysaccharide biosynthesis protein n=1 Tax=Oceanobacillus senegalensis TaxID=1936063 RepID=UPI000A3098B3|nr:polysaccharide biosynthesis protein [Oceanobacillus senegalensis]